jgi:hypothetical protein
MPWVTGRIGEIAALLGVARVEPASRATGLPVELRHWLISLAATPGSIGHTADGNDLVVTVAGTPVAALSELTVTVETTSLSSGWLAVDARVAPTTLFPGPPRFAATFAGDEIAVETTGEYAGFRLFGHRMLEGVHLRLALDLRDLPRGGTLAFVAHMAEGDLTVSTPLPLAFGLYSHLSQQPGMHWRQGGWCFTARDRGIDARPISRTGAVLQEAALIARLLFSGRLIPTLAGFTRLAYRLTRPVLSRRNIWLTHDKMYSAGDSGEYMYHYLAEHAQGMTPYYAINRDAPEVRRLRAEGCRLAHPGTPAHALVFLNANVILATHASPVSYNGLGGSPSLYLRDLYRGHVVCIQHGITMADFTAIQHRTHAGTERYYCASKYEVENLLDPGYGYSREQLVLTGVPRFDGLHSNPKRHVLVAPTWRPELAGAAKALNMRRAGSNAFLETDFFRIFFSVLTDERLLACARETGYTIDLVLHPYVSANAPAVAKRLAGAVTAGGVSPVRVVVTGPDAPYETVMEEADLMVTDFSGVQYDFAYMGKPVVYFHPPELPSQYEHGAMDYTTMGFGEIATTVEELVDVLCAYLRRDCAIEPRFAERIEDFFAFRDDHSRARIFADLRDYMARLESS